MSFYKNLYETICQKGKNNLCTWSSDNEMKFHRHHIIPKHKGGTDLDNNYTYLTIREHYIAHWLLWKIYGDHNDLCASYLLQNKENKALEVRKIWASMGGKVGGNVQKELEIGIHCHKSNPILHKKWASLGGKAHKGKKQMYKPGDKSFIRVLPTDCQKYLDLGFVYGSPLKPNKGKRYGPSKRRKSVTDGSKIYESVYAASEAYNVTPSAIIYRLKSPRNVWSYVSDIES